MGARYTRMCCPRIAKAVNTGYDDLRDAINHTPPLCTGSTLVLEPAVILGIPFYLFPHLVAEQILQ